VHAGRLALFLSWCAVEGIDWRVVRLDQMVRFKRWLIAEPLPSRRCHGTAAKRFRSESTADAVLGTVCGFFRFCARHELMDPALVQRLHEPRYLRFLPPGYEAGEEV
jgi:hypothetical protein